MKTYQCESVIRNDGMIPLPAEFGALRHHRVKVILIDLDTQITTPLTRLAEITERYLAIVEPDLPLDELYRQRGLSDERHIDFD